MLLLLLAGRTLIAPTRNMVWDDAVMLGVIVHNAVADTLGRGLVGLVVGGLIGREAWVSAVHYIRRGTITV
jgi:hypothetical protein